MRRLTDYWLAQVLIFILLTTLPLIALSVVEAKKVLAYTHDWLIFIIMNLMVLHYVARKIIAKNKAASTLKKLFSILIAIVLTNLVLLFPLNLLTILWDSESTNRDKLYYGLIAISINIHIIWCIGYQMALSAREKSKLEQDNQKLNLKILAQQIQPEFLYQSLDNIEELIEQDEELASNAITDLAELLRYKLKASKLDNVLVGEELQAVKHMQCLANSGEINIIDLPHILAQNVTIPPLCIYNLLTLLNQKIASPLSISFQIEQGKWYLIVSGVLTSPRLIRRKILKQYEIFFRQDAELTYINQQLILSVKL